MYSEVYLEKKGCGYKTSFPAVVFQYRKNKEYFMRTPVRMSSVKYEDTVLLLQSQFSTVGSLSRILNLLQFIMLHVKVCGSRFI